MSTNIFPQNYVSFFSGTATLILLTLLLALNIESMSQIYRSALDYSKCRIHTRMRKSGDEKWKNIAVSSQLSGWRYIQYAMVIGLFELPKEELLYGVSLLRPCPRPPANSPQYSYEMNFSFRKFLGDFMRFFLMPLWLLVGIFGGIFVLMRAMLRAVIEKRKGKR